MLSILDHKGPQTVSSMGEETGRPLSNVSENLRILNARGLLRVKRQGREVRYALGADPTIPGANELLQAVLITLRSHPDGAAFAFKALTALTHYRRHHILYALHAEPLAFAELWQRNNMSRQALQRHLQKLRSRGLIEQRDKAYNLAKPKELLQQCLLRLASQRP